LAAAGVVRVQRVVRRGAHGSVLRHEVVVPGFPAEAYEGRRRYRADHDTRHDSRGDRRHFSSLVIQQNTRDATFSSRGIEIGFLTQTAAFAHVVASRIVAINILVGTDPVFENTTGRSIARGNLAVIGRVRAIFRHGLAPFPRYAT